MPNELFGIRHSDFFRHSSLDIRHFFDRRRIRALRRFRPGTRQIPHNLNILKYAALARAMLLDPLGHGRDTFFQRRLAPIAEGAIGTAQTYG